MSKYFNFEDSTFPVQFAQKTGKISGGMSTIPEDKVHLVVEVALMAISDYASVVKTKETPIAVVIDDFSGNPVLGLKVSFLAGTDDNPEGSWCPEWTFDPDDLEGCNVYKVSESKSYNFFAERAKAYHMHYAAPNNGYISALTFAEALVEWLDSNAKVDEKVGLEMPKFFKAAVTVIDGLKVNSFSADEEVTNLVKDDAKLQTPA